MMTRGSATTATRQCRFSILAALVGLGVTLTPFASFANISASTAADVCAVSANPCNVTTQVDVVNNSTLDFGTRDINISGGGRFAFSSGNGAIKCGNFIANPGGGNFAISAKGPGPIANTTASGVVEVAARKACSQGTRACLKDTDCQLGACSVRRCSLRSTRTCTGDSDCQFGTCLNTKRCSLNNTIRCTSNAQCDLGTCPAQLTCEGDSVTPVACSADAQCEFGTCSVGSGSIDVNGPIVGNSDVPAIILLHAANTISIRKDVNLNSTALEGDGGELEMTTTLGDIELFSPAKIDVTGGGDANGGAVRVVAGGSLRLGGAIDCIGGDFDGGAVDIAAGVDVVVSRDINCNAASGAGFGGEILIDAGRDLSVNGVSTLNRTDLFTQGHTDAEDTSGDGGTQELTAGRNLALNRFTTYQGSGSAPEGFGSDLFLTAGGNFLLNGQIESRSEGLLGAGGFVQVSSGGTSQVLSEGLVDLIGGSGGGGVLEFISGGAVDFQGAADATGGSQGAGGSVFVNCDADVSFSGHLVTNGGPGGAGDGQLEIDACRITVGATALLDNDAQLGINRLKAHESMRLEVGSQLLSATGSNLLVYRTATKPPVRNGTISPAPQLVVDSSLVGCPVCGNAELDQTETCDDGNTVNGDGCSSDCQNENCIAQTPGYPGVPLCSDGDDCSVDTCNTALAGGTCQHQQTCDDGIACTNDACVLAHCEHTPVDAACADTNVCTNDLCSAQTGCSHVANAVACDDGQFCTQGDHCLNQNCVGGGALDCSDAVACTVDGCSEASDQCTHQPSNALCANGTFCDGAEICDALTGCGAGAAVDCSNLDGTCVTGVCDEAGDVCSTQAANEGGDCDDGNFCTVNDRCQSGVCSGDPRDCADAVSCTVDGCNETSDQCTHQASDALCSNGTFCDGAEICNVDTGCGGGDPVDCSNLDGTCGVGVCNEQGDTCSVQAVNEGGDCDDGGFCTLGDHCQAGVCTGDQRDCADSVSCTIDACDEAADQCTHQASDALCSNGTFCDGVETCNAVSGCAGGSAVDCSNLNATCVTGVCNEDQDACATQPANEAGSCDDGNFCTVDDTCNAGLCGGGARDCSALDGECVVGVCNEAGDTCATQARPGGTQCDDGDACTSDDQCDAGVCQGQPIAGCGVCGDAEVGDGEECDDGDAVYVFGQYCGPTCLKIGCGKPTNSSGTAPKSADALFTLRSAVGSSVCDKRVCDADNSNTITASDALRVLRAAVGQAVTLTCPAS
ncbi:MAG: hypothetical protein HY899_12350 [Deltaproteobacteria bacterium]|nr:hypothetical protein [Deltaproteobacteria bacterium]